MIGRIATARGRRAAREFAVFAARFLPVSSAVSRDAVDVSRDALTVSRDVVTGPGFPQA
jgi:hypothetical protein